MSNNLDHLNNKLKCGWDEEFEKNLHQILINIEVNKSDFEKAKKVFDKLYLNYERVFFFFLQETLIKGDALFKFPKKETLADDKVFLEFYATTDRIAAKNLNKMLHKYGINIEDMFYLLVQETARLGKLPFELPYAEDVSEEELAYINSSEE